MLAPIKFHVCPYIACWEIFNSNFFIKYLKGNSYRYSRMSRNAWKTNLCFNLFMKCLLKLNEFEISEQNTSSRYKNMEKNWHNLNSRLSITLIAKSWFSSKICYENLPYANNYYTFIYVIDVFKDLINTFLVLFLQCNESKQCYIAVSRRIKLME